jgi:hypothetical protein
VESLIEYRELKLRLFRLNILRILHSIKESLSVRENLSIIALVWIYLLAVYFTHGIFDIRGQITLIFYSHILAVLAGLFTFLFFVLHFLNKSAGRYFGVNHLIGFLIIFFHAPLFVSSFSSFKQTIPLIHEFRWDVALMKIDYILHFGQHPWKLLEPVLHKVTILRFIDLLYMLWFLVLFSLIFWMGWTKRRRLRLHFFTSTILVWSLLGSGMGTVFSSAGPCYYSNVISVDENPFAPLMHRLTEIHQNTFLWAVNNQVGLWQAKENGIWLPFGGISAMPSIHLAMAMIFVMLGFSVRRWIGYVFLVYLFIMQLGSVILGWHYAIDGYVGIFLAFLIWKIVERIFNRYPCLDRED